MHRFVKISAVAATLAVSALAFPAAANAGPLEGAAIGAGTGAVVAGPVGAVVGAGVGAVVGGPNVVSHRRHYRHRSCWHDRNGYRHCR